MRIKASSKAVGEWLIAVCAVLGLSACAGPPVKAPLVDRYTNLIEGAQLKPGPTRIDGARDKVLAVVFSQNTVHSLAFNAELKKRLTSLSGAMTLNYGAIEEDVNVVLSEDGLLGALFLPLKNSFKEVRLVKSIPEGFEGGADYVGVLDLDLYFVNLDSKYEPTPIIHNNHTANCSISFIDPDLVVGPDVVSKTLYKQETTPKFADANNRDFLYAVKTARGMLVSDFTAKVNAAVAP